MGLENYRGISLAVVSLCCPQIPLTSGPEEFGTDVSDRQVLGWSQSGACWECIRTLSS